MKKKSIKKTDENTEKGDEECYIKTGSKKSFRYPLGLSPRKLFFNAIRKLAITRQSRTLNCFTDRFKFTRLFFLQKKKEERKYTRR